MVSCAINGLGLALVIPCVQSLVADYHPSESRGKAFGFMFFTASCGTLSQRFRLCCMHAIRQAASVLRLSRAGYPVYFARLRVKCNDTMPFMTAWEQDKQEMHIWQQMHLLLLLHRTTIGMQS